MNPLAVVARCLRWPCRFVVRAVDGWAAERIEMKLRPSMRVVDIGDVTFDLADVATPDDLAAAGIDPSAPSEFDDTEFADQIEAWLAEQPGSGWSR